MKKKGINRIDENLPADVKNQLFIARNYKQIFIASVSIALVSVVFSLMTVNKQSKVIQEQSEVIKNMANKVVFVRADGKVVQLEKEEVSETMLTYSMRDLIFNHLFLSGFDLMDSKVSQFSDTVNIPKVKKMLSYLTDEGRKWYGVYAEMIYSAYVNNNLPEIIHPSLLGGSFNDNLKYQEGKFMYEATVPVYVFYVMGQEWRKGSGSINIKIKGHVNMSESSPENPLGIKLTSIEVSNYVSKR